MRISYIGYFVEWFPLPGARSAVQRHGPLHLAQGTPHPRPPCGLQQRDQPQPPGPVRFFNARDIMSLTI